MIALSLLITLNFLCCVIEVSSAGRYGEFFPFCCHPAWYIHPVSVPACKHKQGLLLAGVGRNKKRIDIQPLVVVAVERWRTPGRGTSHQARVYRFRIQSSFLSHITFSPSFSLPTNDDGNKPNPEIVGH